MANPYQDVIDWLNTAEGIEWARTNHKLVGFRMDFYQVIEPGCGSCINGTTHIHHQFRRAAGDLSQDGPFAVDAELWVRRGVGRSC